MKHKLSAAPYQQLARAALTSAVALFLALLTGLQSQPAAQPVTVDPSPVAAPVLPAGSGDPLELLAHPPAGLRPWPIDPVNGRLVLSYRNKHRPPATDAEFALGDRFFHLLALTQIPGAIATETDTGFLASLFDEIGARTILPGGASGWGGRNELEQAQSRQTFLRSYAPRIVAIVPKPPFTLLWTEPALLGQYDTVRGGFPVRAIGSIGLGSREQLSLLTSMRESGLTAVPGFTWPDLFWRIDQTLAADVLRRSSDRTLELGATIEVGQIDPISKEVPLKLDRLSLQEPATGVKLYDYPIQATIAAPVAANPRPGPAVTAAPGNTASADTLRHWNLPTRDGLPWIDVQDGGVLQFGSSWLVVPDPVHPKPPTSQELWARAIRAMALAAVPDAELTDNDAAILACNFLPRPTQMQMFQQDSCHFQPAQPGAGFAMTDGANAFRAREPARIRAEAPRLPFTLLLVMPVFLKNYDAARAGFDLDFVTLRGFNKPISLYGSPIDVLLPEFWQASEEEARRYTSTQTDNVHRAWFALTLTMVGTTPGQGTAGYTSTDSGLPNHRVWRTHSDKAMLYLDAGLHTPLHDFTGGLQRLPQPILGTEAEQAPKATGNLPLDDEATLLQLLHQSTDLPAGLTIDWKVAANRRFQFERTIRNRPDWRDFDAWGVFFPLEPDAAVVERYRAWTFRRAAAMPDTITFTRLLSPPVSIDELSHMPVFGQAPRLLSVGSYSAPGTDTMRRLLSRGIPADQLVQVQPTVVGSQYVPVYLVLPASVQSYTIQNGAGVPAGTGDQSQPSLVVRSTIADVEMMHTDPEGKRMAAILRVVPKAVDVRRGSVVLFTSPLTGPPWPRPSGPPPGAAQRAADGPHGPDMTGIRLGMLVADAEALVRANLHVTRVLTTRPETSKETTALYRGRLLIDEASGEAIALFDAPPRIDGRVAAAWRTRPVPRNTWDTLLPRLNEKYGRPGAERDHEAVWVQRYLNDATTGNCEVGEGDVQWTWMLAGSPAPLNAMFGEIPTTVRIASDPKVNYEGCGPVLRVRNPQLSTGKPNVPFETQLFDLGVESWLAHSQSEPAATSASPPIKF